MLLTLRGMHLMRMFALLGRAFVFPLMIVRVQVRVGMAVDHVTVMMFMGMVVTVRMLLGRHGYLHLHDRDQP